MKTCRAFIGVFGMRTLVPMLAVPYNDPMDSSSDTPDGPNFPSTSGSDDEDLDKKPAAKN